jgi:hypothetical protein
VATIRLELLGTIAPPGVLIQPLSTAQSYLVGAAAPATAVSRIHAISPQRSIESVTISRPVLTYRGAAGCPIEAAIYEIASNEVFSVSLRLRASPSPVFSAPLFPQRFEPTRSGHPRQRDWERSDMADIRHAVRLMRSSPLVTSILVLTMTLGVGATTALFSVVYGVLFRPLPYYDPDRLMQIRATRAARVIPSVSYEGNGPPEASLRLPAARDRTSSVATVSGEICARTRSLTAASPDARSVGYPYQCVGLPPTGERDPA